MYKRQAIEHAKANQQNVVLIDTAGRLHVDEDMAEQVRVVVDAMGGDNAPAEPVKACLLYTSRCV